MAKKTEEKETKINQNVENNQTPVVNSTENNATPVVKEINEKEIEKEAQETAKKVKTAMVRIKLPEDPLNPKDLMVPVVINGYQWLIKRGETVEVPEQVSKILEDAKYI